MRSKWALLLVTTIACGALSAACGDDDDNGDKPRVDAGGIDTGVGNGGDGGDGGPNCTFASYVIGLVNTKTTASAQPDTTLGAGCKDTTSQAEFKPLFP